tara:strand:- start:35338 stop:35691 length:354 start_codon:yes stop_codon:yes gene_type:complete
MRKIEKQMNTAIRNCENFSSSNTRVIYSPIRNSSEVYLHGNLIAIVSNGVLQMFDGGWQSNTTKSRLNALCDEFCQIGEGVFQKDFTWYVRRLVSQSVITGKVFNVDNFSNGYIFAA